jgi:hypothetical protein
MQTAAAKGAMGKIADSTAHPAGLPGCHAPSPAALEDLVVNQKSFGIHLTDTPKGRNAASMLINKMYAWRGYAGTHQFDDDPNRITLTGTDRGEVVGTLTLGIDSPIGLVADETFERELDAWRARPNIRTKLCEITKLAFDPTVRSKKALATLFHLAVIYARDLHACTDIAIEVNPRHRRFYENMIGFRCCSELRSNASVNAPAYLLMVDIDFVTAQIRRHAGTFESPGIERSFYPYCFSPHEELGIVKRLKLLDQPGADDLDRA